MIVRGASGAPSPVVPMHYYYCQHRYHFRYYHTNMIVSIIDIIIITIIIFPYCFILIIIIINCPSILCPARLLLLLLHFHLVPGIIIIVPSCFIIITVIPGLHNKIPAQKIFARGWVAQEPICS